MSTRSRTASTSARYGCSVFVTPLRRPGSSRCREPDSRSLPFGIIRFLLFRPASTLLPMTGEDGPELADVGRLARKLVGRAVRLARQEDQPLRRTLLDHLGPDAAFLPTVSDTCPLYDHVNLQVGVDAWLAADPDRRYETIGITGVGMLRFNDVTIGDIIQSAPDGMYGSAGVGS